MKKIPCHDAATKNFTKEELQFEWNSKIPTRRGASTMIEAITSNYFACFHRNGRIARRMPMKKEWGEKRENEPTMACDQLGRCCFRIYGFYHFSIYAINVHAEPAILARKQSFGLYLLRKVPRIFIFIFFFIFAKFYNFTHDFCRQYTMPWRCGGNECMWKLLTAVWKLQWKRCTKLNYVDKIKDFVVAVRALLTFNIDFGIFARNAYTLPMPIYTAIYTYTRAKVCTVEEHFLVFRSFGFLTCVVAALVDVKAPKTIFG